jgi:formamidopyrimidine-DNA glycosylase
MPELPDVETMRRYLASTSLHQTIEAVQVEGAGILLDHGTSAQELQAGLEGRTFASTRRHGKHLFVALDGAGHAAGFLELHFGMTGGLTYVEEPEEAPPYARVLFCFANGHRLAYHAMRKLGEVALIDDVERFVERRDLGPDALDPAFDLAAFKEAVAGRRVMVKAVLMDQRTMAGIGNVYVDEIAFQAGVHPRTSISQLDEETLARLYHAMKDVLRMAVACQAQPEQFPDSFLGPHRHEGGRCPRCGIALERVKVASRTAYFCPHCQGESDASS